MRRPPHRPGTIGAGTAHEVRTLVYGKRGSSAGCRAPPGAGSGTCCLCDNCSRRTVRHRRSNRVGDPHGIGMGGPLGAAHARITRGANSASGRGLLPRDGRRGLCGGSAGRHTPRDPEDFLAGKPAGRGEPAQRTRRTGTRRCASRDPVPHRPASTFTIARGLHHDQGHEPRLGGRRRRGQVERPGAGRGGSGAQPARASGGGAPVLGPMRSCWSPDLAPAVLNHWHPTRTRK